MSTTSETLEYPLWWSTVTDVVWLTFDMMRRVESLWLNVRCGTATQAVRDQENLVSDYVWITQVMDISYSSCANLDNDDHDDALLSHFSRQLRDENPVSASICDFQIIVLVLELLRERERLLFFNKWLSLLLLPDSSTVQPYSSCCVLSTTLV